MKKKIIVLLMMVLCLMTCLSACTKKEEPEPVVQPSFELAGKTYFNTVDNYGHEDHSKLWLGKDGTFVMADSYADGVKDITGKWTLSEDVLTLETDGGNKIIFEVKDDDTLTLKSSLDGSKSDDSFSTTEVKGSSVTPKDSGSSSSSSSDSSSTESKSDSKTDSSSSSSTTTEPEKKGDVPCTGITSLYHNYWSYEGTKNWDLEIKAQPEGCTDKMYFKSNDESVVKIDDQGRATAVGVGKTTIDVTCGSKKLTVGYEVKDKAAPEGSGASKWVCKNPNAAEGCWPNVSFDGKGNFVIEENGFSGMGYYYGTYEIVDGRYHCYVSSIKAERCSMPDVSEIIFKIVDEKTLKLKTGLQMSQNGDLFYLE